MDQAVAQSLIAPAPARTRADGVRFELATPADDAEIRRLLRENPMPGEVSISLEREPDASIAAAVEADVHHTIVARDPNSGRLMGMGCVSVRDMYLNGEVRPVGYLGQLRLDRRYRPRASLVIGGYRLFRELHESLGVRLYLTSIAADNSVARRFLERGVPGMPTYRRLDTLITTLIQSLSPAPQIRRGTIDDLPEIRGCLDRNGRRYQFAPVWREDDLIGRMRHDELKFFLATRRNRVIGCIATWDQSAYKQAVVRGYSARLVRWRRWINLLRRFIHTPRLPPVGTKLNVSYLSHLAVDDDDANVFIELVRAACSTPERQCVLGLSARHPLLRALPQKFRRQTYRTNLYTVHWPDDRADVEALDDRPAQPEVALL